MSLPKREDLNIDRVKVEHGAKTMPQFTVIYGKGDTGKTTLACHSPAPILIPVGRELCHEKFHVHKIPNTEKLNPILHLFEAMEFLRKKPHSRKTLVIDNLSCYREAVEEDVIDTYPAEGDRKATSLGDYGYGKGQAYAFNYYTRLLEGIDRLIKEREMHVILIAHEVLHTVNLPDGKYYQKTGIYAPTGDKTNVCGLLEQRANNVLYIRCEDEVRAVKNHMGIERRIVMPGRKQQRIVYTKPYGDVFAKTKSDIDSAIEIEHTDNINSLNKELNNPSILKLFERLYA